MSKYRYTNRELVDKHNMTSIEVKRSEYRDMLQNRAKLEFEDAEICLKLLISNQQRKLLTMCDLSNAEVLNRWKQCHSSGRKTAADYWYDFMAKRVQCGRKGSQRVLSEMDAIGNK